ILSVSAGRSSCPTGFSWFRNRSRVRPIQTFAGHRWATQANGEAPPGCGPAILFSERLRHIIVGTGIESLDLLIFFMADSQDHDRNVGGFANVAARFKGR